MADLKSEKKVWMNALRQTKEYKLSDQGGEYTVPCKGADAKPSPGFIKAQEEAANNDGERDYIEEAKILIVDKITKHFQDVMFEMVCKEMGNHYIFQSQNYLTEAGYEMFEEEWFEFYHEHHGDILYEVMQNITN